jgi:hypothetical protein
MFTCKTVLCYGVLSGLISFTPAMGVAAPLMLSLPQLAWPSSSLALEHLGLVCHMTEEGPLLTQGHVELSTSEHTAQVELFSHALHPGNNFVVFVKQVPITEAAGIAKYFKAASTPCPC